jgi:hypothetical protein
MIEVRQKPNFLQKYRSNNFGYLQGWRSLDRSLISSLNSSCRRAVSSQQGNMVAKTVLCVEEPDTVPRIVELNLAEASFRINGSHRCNLVCSTPPKLIRPKKLSWLVEALLSPLIIFMLSRVMLERPIPPSISCFPFSSSSCNDSSLEKLTTEPVFLFHGTQRG